MRYANMNGIKGEGRLIGWMVELGESDLIRIYYSESFGILSIYDSLFYGLIGFSNISQL